MADLELSSFGDFLLDKWVVQPRLSRITHGNRVERLEPKCIDLLVFLARHPEEVHSRERLIDEVWRVEAVAENTLTHAIAALRKALGDDARNPRYIETIHRRGYRLLVTPGPVSDEDSSVSRTLSHFLLLEHLGGGGMGVVYRAEDTKLEREVALKFLPKGLSSDPEARDRFIREARAASALDHPHICTIHEIDETPDAQLFIAMAFYEGETLKKKTERGPLRVDDAVRFAGQIAEGLRCAHGEGIVHRDIKPANVMITMNGTVKILDFGLAKLIQPLPEFATESAHAILETSPGTLIGTAAYMSPEQVSGGPVDHRSDIFALGVVLYEMLSGKRPFSGVTKTETAAAILKEEPPALTAAGVPVPAELERTVRSCLEKSPQARFQSASDLAIDLRTITTNHAVPMATPTAVTPVRRRRPPMWIGAGATLLVVAAMLAWMYLRPSERDLPPLRTIPLTSFPGEELQPAISPDGNMVAFVRLGESRIRDLYVKLIGGGDPLLVSDGTSDTWAPSWSPDGRRIACYRGFTNTDGERSIAVDSVPALRGQGHQLTTSRAGPVAGLSWSPDGTTLAMVDKETPDEPIAIFLLSLESGEKRRLTQPPPDHIGDLYPRFAPNGGTVAFVRKRQELEANIHLVSVGRGEPRLLATGYMFIAGLDWTPDGREIIFSGTRQGTPGFNALWRVAVAGGEPEMLAVGEEGAHPTLSRRHALMSYQRTSYRVDLWRVGGPYPDAENRSPTRFISSSTYNNLPRYSPNGEMIAFGSHRSGFDEVWVCDHDGSNPTQLTHSEGFSGGAGWSPDGRQIVFTSITYGNWDLFVISPTGGIPRRFTETDSEESYPSWSRDGRWVYFRSDRNGSSFELYRMPAEGGDAVQLTTAGGFFGVESLDGQSLFFTKRSFWEGPHGTWRIPAEGGEEVKIHDRGEGTSWEVLETGICYLNLEPDIPTVEFLDFDSGKISHVAEVEGASMWGFGVSPDGRWVVYQRQERESDIMLVENFR